MINNELTVYIWDRIVHPDSQFQKTKDYFLSKDFCFLHNNRELFISQFHADEKWQKSFEKDIQVFKEIMQEEESMQSVFQHITGCDNFHFGIWNAAPEYASSTEEEENCVKYKE